MPRPRIYLDQAATSHPKPDRVWASFQEIAQNLGAPAGRGGYRAAMEASRSIERTRHGLATFFGASPDRVVFTLNATDAINMAIKGLIGARHGDFHVVTTAMEHNSVSRPLAGLERAGRLEVSRVGADPDGFVAPERLVAAIRPSTQLVALVHASNVCGTIQPVREVTEVTRSRGIRFLLDAAQTAGSLPIDVERDRVDLLAVPGHKGLLGPPGTGALVLGEGVDVEPWREGGTGNHGERDEQPREYPSRLEAGSPNTPGIAALGAAIEYLQETGLSTVRAHLERLMRRFQDGIDAITGLMWRGPRDIDRREPVYSVTLHGVTAAELASILDSHFGIEVRAGLHCAPGAHRTLGTFPEGSCRFSFGLLNTLEEVDAAVGALREIAG